MIISASRRTDIPAFYADWFAERIRDGYVLLKNPFNAKQVRRVSLEPLAVDAIVFWTRNPKPLLKHLPELDRLGHRYYFQFTITGYPRALEPSVPNPHSAIESFKALSDLVGPDRVIWRFDPILISDEIDENEHLRLFSKIAGMLEGRTRRVMISFVDSYGKVERNLGKVSIGDTKFRLRELDFASHEVLSFVQRLSAIARARGMEIYTCAERANFESCGVLHGKCIDDELLFNVFGYRVDAKKDRSQREECGCVKSIDIGVYNSCLHGCAYCYATQSTAAAMSNYKRHEKSAALLIGNIAAETPAEGEASAQESLF